MSNRRKSSVRISGDPVEIRTGPQPSTNQKCHRFGLLWGSLPSFSWQYWLCSRLRKVGNLSLAAMTPSYIPSEKGRQMQDVKLSSAKQANLTWKFKHKKVRLPTPSFWIQTPSTWLPHRQSVLFNHSRNQNTQRYECQKLLAESKRWSYTTVVDLSFLRF